MSKQIIKELTNLLGSENVHFEDEYVRAKSEDIIPETKTALGFVYPTSVEEIQGIVKLADTYSTPLWPVGKGQNWGYGGMSPAVENTLVVHLEKMNKIHEVNVDLAYAVVEPGVSFRQLHEYLVEHNIPLWIDSTDGPADGSIVGNSLERGIGETDYGDHFGNICGIEAVLPDGSLFQTGGGHSTISARGTRISGVSAHT